jgi:hypothetical protein
MQSTPSRTKHSTSILAPLINVDIFCFPSRFGPSPKSRHTTKKAIGWFRPADGLWNLRPGWPSSGAGYDDRDNNSDGIELVNRPDWKKIEHRRTSKTV